MKYIVLKIVLIRISGWISWLISIVSSVSFHWVYTLFSHGNLDETNSCRRRNGCLHNLHVHVAPMTSPMTRVFSRGVGRFRGLEFQQKSRKLLRIDHATSESPTCCSPIWIRISIDTRRTMYFTRVWCDFGPPWALVKMLRFSTLQIIKDNGYSLI